MRHAVLVIALGLSLHGAAMAEPASPVETTTTATTEDQALGAYYDRLEAERRPLEGKDAGYAELGALLLQMIAVLGAVCLLAYLLLGKLLPRLLKVPMPSAKQRILDIVDRLAIDQRRSIMIIRTGELYFLVGVTEQGINLLSRLDADDVDKALQDARTTADKPRFGRLADALVGRAARGRE